MSEHVKQEFCGWFRFGNTGKAYRSWKVTRSLKLNSKWVLADENGERSFPHGEYSIFDAGPDCSRRYFRFTLLTATKQIAWTHDARAARRVLGFAEIPPWATLADILATQNGEAMRVLGEIKSIADKAAPPKPEKPEPRGPSSRSSVSKPIDAHCDWQALTQLIKDCGGRRGRTRRNGNTRDG